MRSPRDNFERAISGVIGEAVYNANGPQEHTHEIRFDQDTIQAILTALDDCIQTAVNRATEGGYY